jgi:hypothetical protein
VNPDPPSHDDAQDNALGDLRRRVTDIEGRQRRPPATSQVVPAPERYIEALENQLPEMFSEAIEASDLIRDLRELIEKHADDLQYAHRKRMEEEHAIWAWQQIKKHAPWVSTLAALVATVVGYLVTHTINVSGKP